MNRSLLVLALALLSLGTFACTPTNDDDPTSDGIAGADTGDGAVNPDDPGSEGAVGPDADLMQCVPGDTTECYMGPSGSKDRGICKAGVSTCAPSGYWGNCEGMVLPEPEICNNGIDENCDGEDGTEENTIDIDGDGYTYCTGDCCEIESECLHPELVNPAGYDFPGNGVDDNCNGEIDEVDACDTGLGQDTADPVDMAKSIDLCPKPADRDYGLLTATLSLADGTGSPKPEQHKIFTGFGNIIKPHTGGSFLMFSSGTAGNPYTSTAEDLGQNSSAPADWYQANGNQFPSSPACGAAGTPGQEPVNDPIMLTLTAKVPANARAFSIDIYFFSREFPEYVCDYNDFFIALLDSTYTSPDPALQNPFDKNLAMDEAKNPVGINLAPAGLFRVCCQGGLECGYTPGKNYGQFCTLGPGELDGTGLYGAQKEGGTGWLVTKGNVVAGEEITLRLAVWDTRDNVLDSMVLIDNFKWLSKEVNPGTSIQE